MDSEMAARPGGRILVDALCIHGVDTVFGVPGESYLAALDAFYDLRAEIRFITCRQEGGASYMAEAYGKLTGRPGVCFVTRGPGAANASVGVHTAYQDSTPMILLVGQVARGHLGREAFQEVDYRGMFGALAKWVVQIDEAARLPELLSQAFHRAVNGRPGPVVVVLPEDMLTDVVAVRDVAGYQRVAPAASGADLARLCELLSAARRPLLILGGGGWTAQAVADLRAFAEAAALPVATSFRCQDLFDNRHAQYAGDLGLGTSTALKRYVAESDLLLVVGARLGDVTTGGYSLVEAPSPAQALIHVHAGIEEIGRVYRPTLGINAGMAEFARQLAGIGRAAQAPGVVEPWGDRPWRALTAELHARCVESLRAAPVPGRVQLAEIVRWLSARLPDDAIITTGAGNYTAWVHRFYRHRSFRTQLSPTNGSMGYGVPAAIAAKLQAPERLVVAFAGDGCFLMNGQELATAVQYGAAVVIIVVNNGMYGTIRMHQERAYPQRVLGTDLSNPDFAALARAFGAHGETVVDTAEFAAAFERALAAGGPALIELRVDPEAVTPERSLAQIRGDPGVKV